MDILYLDKKCIYYRKLFIPHLLTVFLIIIFNFFIWIETYPKLVQKIPIALSIRLNPCCQSLIPEMHIMYFISKNNILGYFIRKSKFIHLSLSGDSSFSGRRLMNTWLYQFHYCPDILKNTNFKLIMDCFFRINFLHFKSISALLDRISYYHCL